MTRIRYLLPLVAVMAALDAAHAQHVSNRETDLSRSMTPILLDAAPIVSMIEGENAEIVRMEFDIVRTTTSTFRDLHAGWTYGILAFGDFRIRDIDVYLYRWMNDRWVLVAKDETIDPSATVSVTPRTRDRYRIDVTAYEFAPGYSAAHYGLVIFHQ